MTIREYGIKKDERMNTNFYWGFLNTMRTGDADLRFYITTVQDG